MNAGGSVAGAFQPPETAEASPDVSADEVFSLVYRQMRKLAARRDLDELVQAAAEQALRSLPSFRGRSQLSTWTFRICYMTVRKHERWYRRWLRRFSLTAEGELPEPALEQSCDDEVLRAERLGRLNAALDRLSVKQRTVILLHDLEELSVAEIAAILEARPAAVRSRLRDGRRALSSILRADPYFGDAACGEKRTP